MSLSRLAGSVSARKAAASSGVGSVPMVSSEARRRNSASVHGFGREKAEALELRLGEFVDEIVDRQAGVLALGKKAVGGDDDAGVADEAHEARDDDRLSADLARR